MERLEILSGTVDYICKRNLVTTESVGISAGIYVTSLTFRWWRGVAVSALSAINEVNQHRARLLLGRVTVCGQVNRLGM